MAKLFRGIIMGAPGSGKGTVASRIVKCFEVKHVSTGDLLRVGMQEGSGWGAEVRAYVESGRLVPDELMLALVEGALASVRGSWLLDGFPRTRRQAELLLAEHRVDGVVNLVVQREVILERVASRWIHEPSGRVYNLGFNAPRARGRDDVTGEPLVQRVDDRPETVRRRLDIYAGESEPVLELFRQAGVLSDFHGSTTDEMWPRVLQYLKTKMVPTGEL